MPNQKTISTPYPLIDGDPHASRVVRYFRLSDWATWAAATAAFPAALYLWGTLSLILPYDNSIHLYGLIEKTDPTQLKMRASLRLGGLLGFTGGFLLAYQRSSCE